MTSKECLEWLKDNYIYLIEEYYNKTLEMKQCVIDMANPKFYIIKEELNRLEKLEDLEEKIGIDLITLLKALESGVWVKEWKEPIKHTCGLKFSKYGKYWILENKTYCLDLKEYGKNWALTRKELENDK